MTGPELVRWGYWGQTARRMGWWGALLIVVCYVLPLFCLRDRGGISTPKCAVRPCSYLILAAQNLPIILAKDKREELFGTSMHWWWRTLAWEAAVLLLAHLGALLVLLRFRGPEIDKFGTPGPRVYQVGSGRPGGNAAAWRRVVRFAFEALFVGAAVVLVRFKFGAAWNPQGVSLTEFGGFSGNWAKSYEAITWLLPPLILAWLASARLRRWPHEHFNLMAQQVWGGLCLLWFGHYLGGALLGATAHLDRALASLPPALALAMFGALLVAVGGVLEGRTAVGGANPRLPDTAVAAMVPSAPPADPALGHEPSAAAWRRRQRALGITAAGILGLFPLFWGWSLVNHWRARLAFAAAFTPHEGEPEHQGKPLSVWLLTFRADGPSSQPEREQAVQAMRRMGAATLPYLTRRILESEAQPEGPGCMGEVALPVWSAIVALGSVASPMIPDLLSGIKDRRTAVRLAFRGSCFGPEAIPLLIEGLRREDSRVRLACVIWLKRNHAKKASAAVPELVRCLQDPDPELREEARNALRAIAPGTPLTPRGEPALAPKSADSEGPVGPASSVPDAVSTARWPTAVGPAALPASAAPLGEAAGRPEISFEERLLATIPEGLDSPLGGSLPKVVFGPDGRSVAYAARRGARQFMVVGDRKGEEFDFVDPPDFSPDGRVVMYRAKKGARFVLVVGDRKGAEYDELYYPVFNPRNHEVAYAARLGPKWSVVVGDRSGQLFEKKVGAPVFSPDGSSVAYDVELGRRQFVVAGDTEGEEFDWVGTPLFDPAGSGMAYHASLGRNHFMVIGGKREEELDRIDSAVYSPEGSILAYGAEKGGKVFLVVGGERGEEFERSEVKLHYELSFNRDGRVVAYVAQKHVGQAVVVVGRRTGPTFTWVKSAEEFDSIWHPTLGPDGSVVAYIGQKGRPGKQRLVVGDRKGEEFTHVGRPVFSPDGRTVAYKAADSNWKWSVVVGGRKGTESFDDTGQPVFSPDGKRVGFGARKGRELWWKVMPVE
ncbi:MAG: HEAT repeat domain-containing protein [Planctomycetes bacterium]|nr:HEAT repeat domain-containing protein [Planctomycetota bacterium]